MPNILVFSGAFDPLHNGHIHMAVSAMTHMAVSRNRNYETWLVPTYSDILDKKKKLTSSQHRVNMLKLALTSEYSFLQDTFICTIELECGNRMGQYELMKELKRQFPKYNFRFLMGADTNRSIRKWRNSRKFTQEMKTLIVPRVVEQRVSWGSKPLLKLTISDFFSWMDEAEEGQHIVLHNAALSEPISSSRIRKLIAAKNWLEARKLLSPKVLKYIRENGLYQLEETNEYKSASGAHLP